MIDRESRIIHKGFNHGAAVFFVKGLLGIIGVPWRVCFDECVEDHEEFSHAGGHDDLEGFALGFEAVCEAADDRIATSCGEGGHVQDAAD